MGINISKPAADGRVWVKLARGLYRYTMPSGMGSYIFRYAFNGTSHMLGLGSILDVTDAEALETVADYRRMIRAGHDPKVVKDRIKKARAQRQLPTPTRECSEESDPANDAAFPGQLLK